MKFSHHTLDQSEPRGYFKMILLYLTVLLAFALGIHAQANITINPITDVDVDHHLGYFSDPYHVPYQNETRVYLSGTTHKYLECDGGLTPKCAKLKQNDDIQWNVTTELQGQLDKNKVQVCGVAGIHPFQTVSGDNKSWDAAVTLHVQENNTVCEGLKGWSVIVHASPKDLTVVDTPPLSWIGDKVLIGNFTDKADANYDGKYFRTPEGKLFLIYEKNLHPKPMKRDGVVAWPMKNFTTPADPNQDPTVLIAPTEGLNSENYHNHSDEAFKLVENGNIRAINGKFLMAYSVAAYNRPTYKIGIAYSDTFLPGAEGYRKVRKENPHQLWGSTQEKEVYYLLQADAQQDGWHWVGNQIRAPGVATVAKIGGAAGDSWVLTFHGYEVGDTGGNGTLDYVGKHRRPFFIDVDVNIPTDLSVKDASDQDLQGWITPKHG